jgi:hypothetical protein
MGGLSGTKTLSEYGRDGDLHAVSRRVGVGSVTRMYAARKASVCASDVRILPRASFDRYY